MNYRSSLRVCLLFITLIYSQKVCSKSTNAHTVPLITASYLQGNVVIDGRISDSAWQSAEPTTRFVQGLPVEGAEPDQATEVRVLYDESAIYIGAIMYDTEPSEIGDQLVRRDEEGAYDYFDISLDANNDRLTGYRFRVSAAGVQRDEFLFDDVRADDAWDAVWQSAVSRNPKGWSAEIRIPLSQLRYNAADTSQSWGINFSRQRLATNERTYFALESRQQHGTVSVFGRLAGLKFPNGSRRFEVKPYVLSDATLGPAETGDPFFDGSKLGARTGLDLRYGLGGDYTLDVTINPDFGQVEVDPAVINLTAFETFFPEKRPFFIEDAQIFDFELSGRRNRLFHSRRIGREPRGEAPDDTDFENIPTQTTIAGAAKLTGRTKGGLALGTLVALTSAESGQAYVSSLGQDQKFQVEPRTLYGVTRARQDFRDGASQIGAIATLMHRSLPQSRRLDFLTSDAYSFGANFEHNWGGPRSRNWVLKGHAAGSYIKGSTEALEEVQTSSDHYFQRPDASRYSLDSTATSMQGLEWELEFQRRSARHWTGSVWMSEITPGFEINDLGFSTSGEQLTTGARLSYQEITPGSLFRNYKFRFFTFHSWRHKLLDDFFSWSSMKHAYRAGRLFLSGEFEFLNYWQTELSIRYSPQALSSTATRGGPLMVDPANVSLTFKSNTDQRKNLVLEPSITYEGRVQNGYRWQTNLGVSVRPSPGWEIEMKPSYSNQIEPAQYVDATDRLNYTPTFGERYIFGELKRQSFSLETRVNIAFNPKLTLQFFAQPLISAGKYLNYKQLLRPESFDFDVFEPGSAVLAGDEVACSGGRSCVYDGERYIDFDGDGRSDFSFSDKDFNIRSLLFNAVLRWEYRPGSTLFLVWQQSRENEVNRGAFDLTKSFSSLLNTKSDNAFILKFNYWFDL